MAWDEDTLKEESLGIKDVAEVVQGRILKHSRVFYERKVAYTEPLLKQEPVKPERYDDLAVAYEKLGRTQEAIALMEAKEKRFPGLYNKNLAIRALRRAEVLGHPLAREHAEALTQFMDTYGGDTPWKKIAAELDAEFAKGQAWVQQEQRKEEALLEQGKLKQVFNY